MLANTKKRIRHGERAGVKCGREAWEGGRDQEPQETPPRVPPPPLRATEGPAARPGRGDAHLPGVGAPASHRPTPGWAEPVATTPARSPSHLHLPGLAAAMMPPASPASATPRRGGRNEDARVTSHRTFVALARVSRWSPSSAGWSLSLLTGLGYAS